MTLKNREYLKRKNNDAIVSVEGNIIFISGIYFAPSKRLFEEKKRIIRKQREISKQRAINKQGTVNNNLAIEYKRVIDTIDAELALRYFEL